VEKLYIDGLFQIKIKTYYEENSRMTRFQRKCRKLFKNPKQFFRDSVFVGKVQSISSLFKVQQHVKYLSLFKLKLYKKPNSRLKYTIITAVYNTEKYLNTYFKSITRQTLDFKEHIQLILVDDGSVDKSAQIIKKWQKKFPNNITYIYQENSGQAIARNQGIPLAKHPWVTFMDSDDFIDPNYFYEVDKQLKAYSIYNIKMVACNMISYYESKNEFRDDRPFRSFFDKEVKLTLGNNLHNNIQNSSASAFFSLAEIKRQNVKFLENSDMTSFEDSHFILRYLANTTNGHNLFCSKPKYYYQKRASKNSTVDKNSSKKSFFIDVLKYGHLDVLKLYKHKYGGVPVFVKNSILYDISWKIKQVLKSSSNIGVLSKEDEQNFLNICDEIFSYINTQTIMSFPDNLSKFGYYYKLGSINCFKKERIRCHSAYIMDYDYKKNLVKLRYFSSIPDKVEVDVFLSGQKTDISYAKASSIKFFDRVFIYEVDTWIPLKTNGDISIKIGAYQLTIDLGGKKYESISRYQILSFFQSKQYDTHCMDTDSCWIFMDRDTKADDNAEHLYRYITKANLKQHIFFAIKNTSSDWQRLKSEGFNLLNFESKEFFKALANSNKIISSHAARYIMQYTKNKQFIWLQHGITINDISDMVNNRSINLLITSTEQEYQSITGNGSTYKLSKKEVVKTGFARHDNLINLSKNLSNSEKKLLIMPTWRAYLIDGVVGSTNGSKLQGSFLDSVYAKAWLGLLKSNKLKALSKKYNFKIQFFPHMEMQNYFKSIKLDKHIELVMQNNIHSMQEYFVNATAMVTDYSSVAFEMAYLEKETIYYQFDEEDFFKYHYLKGYFSYRDDGFGAVVTEQNTLLEEIETIMKNGGKPVQKYLQRIQNTFPVRDNKNCERIYEAILNLDTPV
jgi:glycosyltransferase involved in cell wall biosynthesis/CDP-glycerol glycerophosphotransferase (TagB/SpsB family)